MVPESHPTAAETSWIRNGASVAPEGAGEGSGKAPGPQRGALDPASPSVLHEANEREEPALLAWMTPQESAGPSLRLATVSTRTSMRLETGRSSGDAGA